MGTSYVAHTDRRGATWLPIGLSIAGLLAVSIAAATLAPRLGILGQGANAGSAEQFGHGAGYAASDASAVSGQYVAENQGGTPLAPRQAANQGQYVVENQGGTPLAPRQAANQGQYSVDNPGGVPATSGATQGQYDVANMGGTPQTPADEEEE